jgi:hypothetical protein
MSQYKIKPYTFQRALDLGVKVRPSTNPRKKIDVFDFHNNFITSIGAIGYKDFPTYTEEFGLEYALNKRDLYRKRHQREIQRLGDRWLGSRSYYAWSLLW